MEHEGRSESMDEVGRQRTRGIRHSNQPRPFASEVEDAWGYLALLKLKPFIRAKLPFGSGGEQAL